MHNKKSKKGLDKTDAKRYMEIAQKASVPMVNYGVAIAHMHGILKKSLEPFPEALKILEE